MKVELLLFLTILGILQTKAQNCSIPPPPGIYNVFSLDLNNDGFTTFDIGYFINNVARPNMENTFGVSSSGYNFIFYNSLDEITPMLYDNIVLDEYGSLHHVYTGTGPTFDPLPPCYWPVLPSVEVRLIPVVGSADKDADGILNFDEDTNHNINLMDDDEDNDGIINLDDPVNNLALNDNLKIELSVYPNPVTNGFISFESNSEIKTVSIYNLSGKQLLESQVNSNELNVKSLATGIYFFKFQSNQGVVFKKIVIN